MNQELVDAITELREEEAVALVDRLLSDGAAPSAILDDCRAAMDIIGKRFEAGDVFIPELILAGDIMSQIAGLVKPRMQAGGQAQERLAKVVIGTVQGDIHDIAKDIVAFMLDVNGFEVKDLGIDVPAATFVAAIREFQPAVVGLSGFLTLAFDAMRDTVGAIEAAGLREGRRIMIGGGQVDEAVRAHARADAFGGNAMAAVALCREWMGA